MTLERFLARVDAEPWVGGCWIWRPALNNRGYGVFNVAGRGFMAHRWSYEFFVGPIPEGRQMDHFVCERRACVNPWHVRPVTPRENSLRADTFAALNLAKTHCPQGHAYDDENTYWRAGSWRVCKACDRESSREYAARRRAQRKEASWLSA
jgi:hypothetical protein